MVSFLKKHRYLLFSLLLRIYLIYMFGQVESDYITTAYLIDKEYHYFYYLVMGLGLTILDIMYILQSSLYIYKIEDLIVIRLSKNKYYIYIIEHMFMSFILLLVMQGLVELIFFRHITFHIFYYSILLMISNIIIFRFDNDNIHHYLILLSLIMNTLFKLFI